MMETVTVDEALAKGHRMVSYPVIAILVVVPVVGGSLGTVSLLPLWFTPVCFVAGFFAAWLYWSFTVVKWRLWAFDNVRNVHQLKKEAIEERLIWPDGHLFGKTEIWSAADKEKWAELQTKFSKADVFIDDPPIEQETIVCYSKPQAFAVVVLMLLFVAGGIFLLVIKINNNLLAYALIVIGSFVAILKLVQAFSKKPQIILNERGIQTASTPFYEWKDISSEEAIRERSGKNQLFYLVYTHPNGKVKQKINALNITRKKLNKLLLVYRGRYSNKQSSKVVSPWAQSSPIPPLV